MQGDPVSLVRGATGTPKPQRVWNRTKKEAHTIQSMHCVESGENAEVEVTLTPPGANWAIRFGEIHFNYSYAQAIDGQLTIVDGTTRYELHCYDAEIHRLRFDTVKWATGHNVVIRLDNAGAGVYGYLNVLGAFAEKISDPEIAV